MFEWTHTNKLIGGPATTKAISKHSRNAYAEHGQRFIWF